MPPTKGRAMPGEENHIARLMKIKPETKQMWLNHHSPFVRHLGTSLPPLLTLMKLSLTLVSCGVRSKECCWRRVWDLNPMRSGDGTTDSHKIPFFCFWSLQKRSYLQLEITSERGLLCLETSSNLVQSNWRELGTQLTLNAFSKTHG